MNPELTILIPGAKNIIKTLFFNSWTQIENQSIINKLINLNSCDIPVDI